MNDQSKILGAGLVSGAVLITKALVAGGNIAKPFLGITIATILLAMLDAAGLGAIAAPMALLLAGTVVTYYVLPLLTTINKVI